MSHEERFDRIDANIAELKASAARVDVSIERLTQYVLDFREETARHFEVIDNRLDVLTAIVANIEARYRPSTRPSSTSESSPLISPTIRPGTINAATELDTRIDRFEESVSRLVNPAAQISQDNRPFVPRLDA